MSLFHLLAKPVPESKRHSSLQFRPQVEGLESRLVPYTTSGNAWPNPHLVTISFMPDGTNLGTTTSNLFSVFNAKFGSPATWENVILKAAQVWAQQTNLNFAVVGDSGAPEGSGSYQQGDPSMGDIRIGGCALSSGTLALAYLPPPVNNYSLAGDMTFNTSQTFNINGQSYDLFAVAMHEFGHALGMLGSNSLSASMYETYGGARSGLGSDDINGIRSIYSGGNPRSPDAFGLNNSFSAAANVNSYIDAGSRTALVPNLDLTNAGDNDYYVATAPAGTGGTVTVSVQSQSLSLLAPTLTVYAADQKSVLGTASGAGHYGTTVTLNLTNKILAGQQFYVKVAGADTTAFGTGAYALTMSFAGSPLPAVSSPAKLIANGTPLSGGGGQAQAQSFDFQVSPVNGHTQQTFTQDQAVAMDSKGNFVVTWSSNNQDGNGWGVYAQRYSTGGVPQGAPFQVNTTTQDNQQYASVAADPAGDFVITWSSHNQDGNGWGVYAQRYSTGGVPQGGEFRVNTTTQDDQMYSRVAMDSLGNFVITWSSHNQDGNGWGVYAQRYSTGGVPQGGEFRVNTTTQDDQEYSSVAMDPAGDFVITWSSHNQDGSGWGVYAQRYSAAGIPQGKEFQVNTTTQDDQMYSTAAMDAAGDFVITWSSHNQDGSGWGVYAQRYSYTGRAEGGEFLVNTTTAGDHEYSTVAMDGPGDFLITWSSHDAQQLGSTGWDVYARQYDSGGNADGGEFAVNTYTAGDQLYSSVARDSQGHIVVVWTSTGSPTVNGVLAKCYVIGGDALSVPDGADSSATGADVGATAAQEHELASDFIPEHIRPAFSFTFGSGRSVNSLTTNTVSPGAQGLLPVTADCGGQLLAPGKAPMLRDQAAVLSPRLASPQRADDGGSELTPEDCDADTTRPAGRALDSSEGVVLEQSAQALVTPAVDRCFAEGSWSNSLSEPETAAFTADSDAAPLDPAGLSLALTGVLGCLHWGSWQAAQERNRRPMLA